MALWEQQNENATHLRHEPTTVPVLLFPGLSRRRPAISDSRNWTSPLAGAVFRRAANAMENNDDKLERQHPLTNAVVKLIGENGNAFAILGRVRRGILHSDRPELADEFIMEATSGDYDHLLATCMRYVTVE